MHLEPYPQYGLLLQFDNNVKNILYLAVFFTSFFVFLLLLPAATQTTAVTMSDSVPPIQPAGTNLEASTSTTTSDAALPPLSKLTPRQQEQSGGNAAQTASDVAAAETAKELTSTKKTVTKKKKRPTLSVKFDPESAVNYKSPFMFGTPKATTTPKGSRKSFVSYQKIQQQKQPPTIKEGAIPLPSPLNQPNSPPPNQGELFYEGSKWFWRHNHNIHVQLYNARPCYVARCNVLEDHIEYPPLYISKEAVEESLDSGFIVNGTDGAGAGAEPARRSFGSKEQIAKRAEKQAEETQSRYFEQVAAVIIEKLLLEKDADGNERLTAADSKNGAPLLIPMTPVNLKLPTHEFRVQRKMSVSEFKRVADKFQIDLDAARETVAKAGDRSDATTDHINIWESTTSCQSVADARRHTYSAQQKMIIVKRLSMEGNAMQAALKKMREEDAAAVTGGDS